MLLPLDREALRRDYIQASPYPFVKIDEFLDPVFAKEVSVTYPSFANATAQGMTFNAINERKKVQISDSNRFPAPVAKLNEALASPEFLSVLSYVTGIPDLLADKELGGAGMHITGPGGRTRCSHRLQLRREPPTPPSPQSSSLSQPDLGRAMGRSHTTLGPEC